MHNHQQMQVLQLEVLALEIQVQMLKLMLQVMRLLEVMAEILNQKVRHQPQQMQEICWFSLTDLNKL